MKHILIFLLLIAKPVYAGEWYFGEWKVTGFKFAPVSAMDERTARAWTGAVASYSESSVNFMNEVCNKPVYKIVNMKEGDFYSDYRLTFKMLGIKDAGVTIIEVGCPSAWVAAGATLIRVNNNVAYTLWDGVFFKLEKSRK